MRFHKNFEKKYTKLPLAIRQRFKERCDLLTANPFDTALHNHMLKGKYKGYRSINITGDYRAVYKLIENGTVIFVEIGTHGELYP